MLVKYPYQAMKITSSLHGLIACGVIGANGYALYNTKRKLSSFFLTDFSLFNSSLDLMFAPLIAVGVYILIVSMIGGVAASKSKNKFLVNNFKIFYLVVNILSALEFSWVGGIYSFFMTMTLQIADPHEISVIMKATFGLMCVELLLSIISIAIICISGPPGEIIKPESVPMDTVTDSPITFPPNRQEGFPQNPQNVQFVNTSNQWGYQQPKMW